MDGLSPPGDYTLRPSAPETQSRGVLSDDGSPAQIHLGPGGLVERNFELFWDGRIEGRVSSLPARRPAPGSSSFAPTVGSCRLVRHFGDRRRRFLSIPQMPRGRYLVVVNSGGPGDEWPHDIQVPLRHGIGRSRRTSSTWPTASA